MSVDVPENVLSLVSRNRQPSTSHRSLQALERSPGCRRENTRRTSDCAPHEHTSRLASVSRDAARCDFEHCSLSSEPSAADIEANQKSISPPAQKFKSTSAEIAFVTAMTMSQVIAEYLTTGFAIALSRLIENDTTSNGVGAFWPACLLTLCLCAFLLPFARLSDKTGGRGMFLCGMLWVALWSLIAGFAKLGPLLDVSRAMQGLAIAAYMPATFSMYGGVYPDGKRKNVVMGFYAAAAPLGFYCGSLVAAALPDRYSGWYSWIAAILALLTAICAAFTMPEDSTDRSRLQLHMDYVGSALIIVALIMISYALAIIPFLKSGDDQDSKYKDPQLVIPLAIGTPCLLAALWWEGYMAKSPIVPLDFFRSWRTCTMSLACLCFYAVDFVWLYESAILFGNSFATGRPHGIEGVNLALWYTPTAIGGIVCCISSGALVHYVPIKYVFFCSGLAWVGAPLIFALCPYPLKYWDYVLPSMLCSTFGVDITYTISLIVLTDETPLKYQGLAGAMCSVYMNLAASFALPIAQIVQSRFGSSPATAVAGQQGDPAVTAFAQAATDLIGLRGTFWYATISACVGMVFCVIWVCLPTPRERRRSSVVGPRPIVAPIVLEAVMSVRADATRSEEEAVSDEWTQAEESLMFKVCVWFKRVMKRIPFLH